ncbi:phosphoglycerate kinase [Candidatus Woesearchaeota archaeon]|nr:phosphoglycerate kinase [Candidatus Woesearchaeota archaeon]
MRTLKDLDIKNKRVLLRADFNVPIDDDGNLREASRIEHTLPTIRKLIEGRAAKIIIMSHLGRPDGKPVENLRLGPVAKCLERLLKEDLTKLDDCVGQRVRQQVQDSKTRLVLLENLRFHPEEERNDPQFAKELANLGDVYVNDAFGACHRSHASVDAITKYLPSCAGLLLEQEVRALNKLFRPRRPLVVVLGGSKVSDKIGLIENIGRRADTILIGGAMAFTFLKAQGKETGLNKVETGRLEYAGNISMKNIKLPTDFIMADKVDESATATLSKTIPKNAYALDIGEDTISGFCNEISRAKTIIWNGPMGVFEVEKFAHGTKKIGEAIARADAETVAGGGDTVAAIEKLKLKGFTHVSTGGGAMLEFLEGKKLPGIVALERN